MYRLEFKGSDFFGEVQEFPVWCEEYEFHHGRSWLLHSAFFLHHWLSIRHQASENIHKSQQTNERLFLKKNNPAPVYSAGDYKNTDTSTNTNKKLIAKFRGPYIIHKVLPNDRSVVRDIEGYQVTQIPYDGVLESDKLRLWVQPTTTQNTDKSRQHSPLVFLAV